MGNINTEEVMYKLDMFWAISGKWDEFGCWDMEKIQTDSCTQFTHKEFQEGLSVHGSWISLAAPYQQEINGQVVVTWWKFLTMSHNGLSFWSDILVSFMIGP